MGESQSRLAKAKKQTPISKNNPGVVVQSVIPSTQELVVGRSRSKACPGQKQETLSEK
jgi:hypothetical protein